jgi:hypothetical protein
MLKKYIAREKFLTSPLVDDHRITYLTKLNSTKLFWATTRWWKIKVSCSQWEGTQWIQFFFSCLAEGRRRRRLFLVFSLVPKCVLILFPWGSPSSDVVPKTFPIAPQLYPIWFAQSPTLMCTNWKKVGHRRAYLFLFCYLGSKEVLLFGEECPMFQKKWWWANQCASFQIKKRKKCGCTHELINMNHTHPQEQKGGPFTPWLDFSLVACKFYS